MEIYTKYRIAVIGDSKEYLGAFFKTQVENDSWLHYDFVELDEILKEESGVPCNIDSGTNYDALICILEKNSFDEILYISDQCEKTDLPTIFVTSFNNNIILGPTYFPGNSSGIGSALLYLYKEALGHDPSFDELVQLKTVSLLPYKDQLTLDIPYAVQFSLVKELKVILQQDDSYQLGLLDRIQKFSLKGDRLPIQHISKLVEKGENHAKPYHLIYNQFINTKRTLINHRDFFTDKVLDKNSTSFQSVGIIGGGTAGYLTALALRNKFPNLKINLIESSKIPIIGVGEATTPDIRKFLFDTLGFSAKEFYEKVKPTWKLGIKYVWGQPGDHFFNYPFDATDILTAFLEEGHINNCSLSSYLMSNNASFVLQPGTREGEYKSLSKNLSYAYHLDNKSFVLYLKEKAQASNINYIDTQVKDVKFDEKGNIKSLIDIDRRAYKADLFVDCSGFFSFLMEKKLGSPYISYRDSLFTDTAIVGAVNNHGEVKPFTQATTMDNGWCWSVPMRGEDHRGYVFSSDHCSIEKAEAEMRMKNPTIGELSVKKFKTGRHDHFILKNVVSIGNSYGFVEPLESTGIHMIVHHINTLVSNFQDLKNNDVLHRLLNKDMIKRWDYLRGFLAIHYKFNYKSDSEFWRDARENVSIEGFEEIIEVYKTMGPLSSLKLDTIGLIENQIHDSLFGVHGIDTILLGQGFLPDNIRDFKVINEKIWKNNLNVWKEIVDISVPLKQDIDILTKYPSLI